MISNDVSPLPVPLLIYQMGKVGSTTVWNCLNQSAMPIDVLHPVHVLHPGRLAQLQAHYGQASDDALPEDITRALRIRTLIDNSWGHSRWRVVTLVRDPVGRMVASAFSTCAERIEAYDASNAAHVDALYEGVLDELFDNTWSIDHTLNWFQRELETVFEVDVYAHPFDHAAGYSRIETEHVDLLILRTEDLNRSYAQAFQDFLGIATPNLKSSNTASAKPYWAQYRSFLADVALPEPFVNHILSAPLATHFYTEAERAAMTAKWTKSDQLAQGMTA